MLIHNDVNSRRSIRDRVACHQPARRRASAFTLIELLIVIAIIAMLAALVAPRLMSALRESQIKTTRAQIELLATALESFRISNGRYPTNDEGLGALVEAPEGLQSTWSGPYLRKRKLPVDGWNFPFHYAIPPERGGIDYDLYSLGADGVEGGEGDAAEVGNWG